MISRAWSHEILESSRGRVIVVIETLALAFAGGTEIHGCGLKLPRYVVAGGARPRVFRADGSEAGMDEVRAVYPGIDELTT